MKLGQDLKIKVKERPEFADDNVPEEFVKEPILDVGVSYLSRKHKFPDKKYVSLDINYDCKPDIVGDALSLPFKDKSFGNVICFALLEHVKDPKKVIEEIYRVTKNGGYVFVSVPFIYFKHDWADYTRFTEEGINYLLKDFRIIRSEKMNMGIFSTLLSWLEPLTYNQPKVLKKINQGVIKKLLKFHKEYDIYKDRCYSNIFVVCQK